MKLVLSPLRLLYKIYFIVIFLISGILLYPFMLFLIRGKNKFRNALRIKQVWSKAICVLVFIKVQVENADGFPKGVPYVVCANHASYLDILLMFLILPDDFAFLGKAEVLKWPIINVFFLKGIDIPVYRGSVKRVKECLDMADMALKDGRSIAIFPEGGMEINNDKLRRFKNGAFRLAMDNQVPIVPITFLNNWVLFSDHMDLFGSGSPGIAKIKIHKAISPDSESFKDLVSLREKTHKTIKSALEQYGNR